MTLIWRLFCVPAHTHTHTYVHMSSFLVTQNFCSSLYWIIVCSGPREDATRIGSAGVVRRQAVDISPLRRVNQAIYLLTTGARESAFRNIKTIAECLADELINAAKGSSNRWGTFFNTPIICMIILVIFCKLIPKLSYFRSYAIKKKDEIERVAKANR